MKYVDTYLKDVVRKALFYFGFALFHNSPIV
jgi:hypothetical protein